jgi:hypothetical protein
MALAAMVVGATLLFTVGNIVTQVGSWLETVLGMLLGTWVGPAVSITLEEPVGKLVVGVLVETDGRNIGSDEGLLTVGMFAVVSKLGSLLEKESDMRVGERVGSGESSLAPFSSEGFDELSIDGTRKGPGDGTPSACNFRRPPAVRECKAPAAITMRLKTTLDKRRSLFMVAM